MSMQDRAASESYRAADPAADLPEGSVPEGEVRILSYIGEEGESLYAFTCSEGMQFSNVIGLLEMVGHHLAHRAGDEDELEEEDE